MIAEPAHWGELGAHLRRRREEMRLSLHDTARLLHIRAKYIEALETGDLAALPGEAYVKGYLRTYAAFLSFDPQDVVERFENFVSPPRDIEAYYIVPTRRENVPSPRLVAGSLAVAAIVLFGYALLRERPSSHPRVEELPVRYQALLLGLSAAEEKQISRLDACFSARMPHSYPFCTDLPMTLPAAMEPAAPATDIRMAEVE